MANKLKAKSKHGMTLHKFIATGGKPKDFQGAVKNSVVRPKEK